MPQPKKILKLAFLILLIFILAACQNKNEEEAEMPDLVSDQKNYQNLVVGFSQIGAESEWRTANTESIKESARELGIETALFGCPAEAGRTRSKLSAPLLPNRWM